MGMVFTIQARVVFAVGWEITVLEKLAHHLNGRNQFFTTLCSLTQIRLSLFM